MVLIFDAVQIIVDGRTDAVSRILLPSFTFLYYFMHPVIIAIWTFYVDYHIFADHKRFKVLAIMLSPFIIVNTVFSVLSLFGNYMYYIDANNVYMRGNLFYIVVFTSYFLMFLTMGHLILKRNLIRKSDFKALFFFPFPPLLVAVYQIVSNNVELIWPFMTISVLTVYITVQSRVTSTDPLTGVFNRREYEFQVEQRSKLLNTTKKVGGIMIDVNDLKQINDSYMHHAGDMALIKLAEILKNSIRKDDFVARIGGDEFVIIFEANSQETLHQIVNRIKENLTIFNTEKSQKFELNISIGYGIYDYTKFSSFHDFIHELDRRMYQSKHELKSNI
ncbi:MAG: GGDEF domain-containing protein [Bacillota bacterium]|nr:MAG: GGDEF domain-containing protein [Bacillota bacterium]